MFLTYCFVHKNISQFTNRSMAEFRESLSDRGMVLDIIYFCTYLSTNRERDLTPASVLLRPFFARQFAAFAAAARMPSKSDSSTA